MKTRILLLCTTLLTVAILFSSTISQSNNGKSGHGNTADLARGRKIFHSNCASCHGLDGKGAGLVAGSLRKQPSDLTAIPLKNGKFPTEQLVMSITGELSLPIHGSREMPVWGGVLRNSDILNLVRYIESIQRSLPIPTR